MKKNIIKLTQEDLFKILDNVISEQTANDVPIIISGEIGQASDGFAKLKTFVDDLISKVNSQLQGETPYTIRLIKKQTHVGISSENGKSGEKFYMKFNFVPSEEAKRHFYFTCSVAIYSSAAEFTSLDDEVYRRAVRKTDSWPAEKIYQMGMDLIDLSSFVDLDISDPNKKYKLLFRYLVGSKPRQAEVPAGSEVTPEQKPAEQKPAEQKPAEQKPAEQKPAEQKPAEQKPAEQRSSERRTQYISGMFESFDGDTAHNFKNLEDKLGPVLKEFYDGGINPKITNITAKITKTGDKFVTEYRATIQNSKDGKAWMGFTSRGSFGNGYIERADGQISGKNNKDGKSLEEKLKGIGAGEIETISIYEDSAVPVKQYFVQFTKPTEFPPHK
jgi:hypothetical protein